MDDDENPFQRRGPGLFAVVATTIFTSILASTATVVLLSRAGLDWMPKSILGRPQTRVPNLRELPMGAARELLAARGLKLDQGTPVPDAEVKQGRVARQTPKAGAKAHRGDRVRVEASSGPSAVVPSLVGRPLAEARSALESAKLVFGVVDHTGVCAPGTIVATRPAGGTPVDRDTPVALTVTPDAPAAPAAAPAAGAEAAAGTVPVPDLRLMRIPAARAAVEAAGLRVGAVVTVYNSGAAPRAVLRQTPSAGEAVARGSSVDLVVNQGE